MAKKQKASLVDTVVERATGAKNQQSSRAGTAATEEPLYRQSAVNLRNRDWVLLSFVAQVRVQAAGGVGRPSVSKVIEGLIDDARKSLEAEAKTFNNPFG